MSEAEEKELLVQMTAQPVIKIGSHLSGGDTQERANAAWATLGAQRGFDPMTVEPRSGFGQRHFTAVPSETEAQRNDRQIQERAKKRAEEIIQLLSEIAQKQARLNALNIIETATT